MTLRIQVLVNFGGVETNGLRIPPGEYAIDDDRLLGRGQMLVDRGQARIVGDEPEQSYADRMIAYMERITDQPAQPASLIDDDDVAEALPQVDLPDLGIQQPVTKQVDEAFTASEEAEAVDELVSGEADAEAEDDNSDDTPQTGRRRKAR